MIEKWKVIEIDYRSQFIPSKVKHFMWRLERDCLFNRRRLMSKGIYCQSNCVVC